MSKRTIIYTGLGEVSFVKSRRARRLTLSVKPWRGVRITLPWYSAYHEAEVFMFKNIDWLNKKLAQMRLYEESHTAPLKPAERKILDDGLRLRALDYLAERTAFLAKKHGFSYRRVSIRRSRSRWGSCSAENNINLSIYLMQLPSHLIDYVILHELVHTVHKNHSTAFWELLDHHTGSAINLSREMKKYRTV